MSFIPAAWSGVCAAVRIIAVPLDGPEWTDRFGRGRMEGRLEEVVEAVLLRLRGFAWRGGEASQAVRGDGIDLAALQDGLVDARHGRGYRDRVLTADFVIFDDARELAYQAFRRAPETDDTATGDSAGSRRNSRGSKDRNDPTAASDFRHRSEAGFPCLVLQVSGRPERRIVAIPRMFFELAEIAGRPRQWWFQYELLLRMRRSRGRRDEDGVRNGAVFRV